MCRNIKPLFNFDPPATEGEIRDASLQYVRKISGMRKPSQINDEAFEKAVDEIAHVTQHLMESLVTNVPSRDREVEKQKAKLRSEKRFPH